MDAAYKSLDRQGTTLSLTLSETVAGQWLQLARERSIIDHSLLAAFLLTHYQQTHSCALPSSSCLSCCGPLAFFCPRCDGLTPQPLPQVTVTQTTVNPASSTQRGTSNAFTALSLTPQNNPTTPVSNKKSADSLVDNSCMQSIELLNESVAEAASDNDDTDSEYYTPDPHKNYEKLSIKPEEEEDKEEEEEEDKEEEEEEDKEEEDKEEEEEEDKEEEEELVCKEPSQGKDKSAGCKDGDIFTCDICLRIFFDPDQLVVHMQTHSEHMKHQCQQCKARFFKPQTLSLHMRTQCCLQSYSRHPCDQCNCSFAQPQSLKKHKALKHRGTLKPRGGDNKTVNSHGSTSPGFEMQTDCQSILESQQLERKTTPEGEGSPRLAHLSDLGQGGQDGLLCVDDNEESEEEREGSTEVAAADASMMHSPDEDQSETNRASEADCVQSKIKKTPVRTPKDSYPCKLCGEGFLQKSCLKCHSLTHTNEQRYGCQQCGMTFTQLNILVAHMHKHYDHKPFLCGACHKSFTTLAYMTKHVCRPTPHTFHCEMCGETFATSDQLRFHAKNHGFPKKNEMEEDSLAVYQCGKSLRPRQGTTKTSARKDRKRPTAKRKTTRGRPSKASGKKESRRKVVGKNEHGKHVPLNRENRIGPEEKTGAEEMEKGEDSGKTRQESPPLSCSVCGAGFMVLHRLSRHLQTHSGKNAFSCSQCDVSCRSLARLEVHMRSHNASKDFPCQYCGKILRSLYTLKEHLRSHTGERPYRCEICGAGFTLSSTYKAHMRAHNGERPYLCPHCGKSFVRSSNLSVHIRACTGEKPYACTICGKCFSDVGYYKKHVNNHAGIKPYKCEYCGKAFSQSTSLKLHIRIHTGEKPYKCTECSMTFAIPNSLTEHMRKHTGDKPYKCSICGKGFAKSCNRLAHFRTHSKNNRAQPANPASSLPSQLFLPGV